MAMTADATKLVEAVQGAADALRALVPHAVSLGPGTADAIQSACDAVETGLAKPDLTLAVVGEPSARRALLRGFLGEVAVRTPTGRRERVTRLRTAESYDYVTRNRDGTVTRFARAMPDRDPIYKQSIEQAEQGVQEARRARAALERDVERARKLVTTAEEAIKTLDAELEAAGPDFAEAWRAQRTAEGRLAEIERAAPEIPPIFLNAPPWWAFWFWLLRWIVRSKWREPLALHAHNRDQATVARSHVKELTAAAERAEAARDALKAKRIEETERLEHAQAALAHVEVALAEESALGAADARLEQLLCERSRHAGERKDEFFSDLRDIDGAARGDAVDELDIDLPADHAGAPPRAVVLVFAATSSVPTQGVDGFLVVRHVGKEASVQGDVVKQLPRAGTLTMRPHMPPDGANDVHAALVRIHASKLVVPAKLSMRVRAVIADVALARSATEVEHQRRLGALESQRIPHPTEFRERQLARSLPAIEKGADDILALALAQVEQGFGTLKNEWLERVSTAPSKNRIDACIVDINRTGKIRVLELLEATSELVAREMQSVGETLERWALDEIQMSYRTTKRMRAESLAPVASEVMSEDLAAPIATLVPIGGAREEFQRQRIGIALGGGAAGAAAGSLVRPGLGTIIGALFGLLMAFFKRSSALRKATLERVERYAADACAKVTATLRDKRPDVALGLRAALDGALAETLLRLNESITRLMAVEREAIASERSMLAQLSSTRGTLEEHDERLRASLAAAESALADERS